MSERPYPKGIAWDEAWRQRQRADAVEKTVACAVVRGKLLLFSDAETFRKWIKSNSDGGYLAWVDGVEIVPADTHKCG